ncbi:MAG: flagellar biosynthesis protein FliL [Gammaproteobacteria bacterium]|nr:flagellar biosynthesis protein FliL [Gammaproteobacteria bacterium]
MAEEEVDEDLDLGEEQQGGSKKKLIIIVGAAVLVLLLGGGAAWFFMSGDEESAPESAETEQTDGDEEDADADKEKEDVKEQGPALYQSLDPVFVVNLPPGTGAKMMQISVNLMMRSPELLEFIKLNDPMIRHQLLNLFSTQDATALRKRSGKEKLQSEVLAAVQKIVDEQGGPGKVEAVYFTSFVMQ